jgi:hypothetical protein
MSYLPKWIAVAGVIAVPAIQAQNYNLRQSNGSSTFHPARWVRAAFTRHDCDCWESSGRARRPLEKSLAERRFASCGSSPLRPICCRAKGQELYTPVDTHVPRRSRDSVRLAHRLWISPTASRAAGG